MESMVEHDTEENEEKVEVKEEDKSKPPPENAEAEEKQKKRTEEDLKIQRAKFSPLTNSTKKSSLEQIKRLLTEREATFKA